MTSVVSPVFSLDVRAVTPDVTNFVWTPTKDGSGNILDASWANLPLNAWCEVADSSAVPQLYSLLTGAGFAPTSPFNTAEALKGHLRASFAAWVGGALDEAGRKFYIPWGGGHADGALNGIWRLDLEKMGFAIEAMPSHPDASGFVWSNEYRTRTIPGAGGDYTRYGDASGLVSVLANGHYDALPDGRPCSRHQYDGVIFDSTRGIVGMHRRGIWRRNLSTGVETRSQYVVNGSELSEADIAAPNNWCHYDPVTDRTFVVSVRQYSYYTMYRINEATMLADTTPGIPGGVLGGVSICVMGRKIVFIGLANGVNRAVYDMDTNTWSEQGTISGWVQPGQTDEMQSLNWIPDVGKLLFHRRSDQKFYWIDPVAWTIEEAVFGGLTVPWANWTGSKQFYYPHRKVVVHAIGAVNTSSDSSNRNVYVMRVG